MKASCCICRGPRLEEGGQADLCASKGEGNPQGRRDAWATSPLSPAWSPGCTRSFYSNQNGCRRPWRPQDPGLPWQPSGSGKLEPSCTGTVGKSGMSGAEAQRSHLTRESPAHPVVDCYAQIRRRKEGDTVLKNKQTKKVTKTLNEANEQTDPGLRRIPEYKMQVTKKMAISLSSR